MPKGKWRKLLKLLLWVVVSALATLLTHFERQLDPQTGTNDLSLQPTLGSQDFTPPDVWEPIPPSWWR